MTKKELLEIMTNKLGLVSSENEKLIKASVTELLSQMIEHLSKHERIEIRGFGAFSVKHYKNKCYFRNPRTGDDWEKVPSPRAKFKSSLKLRERMNK